MHLSKLGLVLTLIRQNLRTERGERRRWDRKAWARERTGYAKAPAISNMNLGWLAGGPQGAVPLPTAVGLIAFAGSK
jgi:hypothetical protein